METTGECCVSADPRLISSSLKPTSAMSETERSELQDQKLRAEVWHSRWGFLLPTTISTAITSVVAILTIYSVTSTGVLDARREHLQTQAERLEMQSLRLKDLEASNAETISKLEGLATDRQAELLRQSALRAAIADIYRNFPASTIAHEGGPDSYAICIGGPDSYAISIGGPMALDFTPLTSAANQATPAKLRSAKPYKGTSSSIKNLTHFPTVISFKISGILLEPQDLTAIGQIRGLQHLSLRNSGVESGTISGLTSLAELRTLELACNPLNDVSAIAMLQGLVSLDMTETDIDDSGLTSLVPLSKQLRTLRLTKTDITDSAISVLSKFDGLEILDIRHTAISKAGLEKLFLAAKPKVVVVTHMQVPKEQAAELSAKNNVYIAALDI